MIAKETSLTEQQVRTWFQNRRTTWRKEKGNIGLYKGESFEGYRENFNAGQILSNFSSKLSLAYVFQLHKQITEKWQYRLAITAYQVEDP